MYLEEHHRYNCNSNSNSASYYLVGGLEHLWIIYPYNANIGLINPPHHIGQGIPCKVFPE